MAYVRLKVWLIQHYYMLISSKKLPHHNTQIETPRYNMAFRSHTQSVYGGAEELRVGEIRIAHSSVPF